MHKRLLAGIAIFCFSGSVVATGQRILTGAEANRQVEGSVSVRYVKGQELPAYIRLSPDVKIPASGAVEWLHEALKLRADDQLVLRRVDTDLIGRQHMVLDQYYKGIPVYQLEYRIHLRDGFVISANGHAANTFSLSTAPALSGEEALEKAKQHIGADVYRWEIASHERNIKLLEGSLGASYYPSARLTVVQRKETNNQPRLAYRLKIYAQQPLSHQVVLVDAVNGKVICTENLIHSADVPATVTTVYSGVRNIVAGNAVPGVYYLREYNRDSGPLWGKIETFNNENTTDNNYTDFVDTNNSWLMPAIDQYALDAHWGTEMTYDYYKQKLGRNSLDNFGLTLRSWIHTDVDMSNAYWDGIGANYGDGNGVSSTAFTSIEIVGHELSHGLTQFTAGLQYQDESGALNESFSDIFGVSVEQFATGVAPSTNHLWLIGDEVGQAFRNMKNPKSQGMPHTYLGQYWYSGTDDNGGVHHNSSVQNFWFFLLVNGGTGTNDNGESYVIDGIGIDDAALIAYYNLSTYLSVNSTYDDAAYFASIAAVDLFGDCSEQVYQTSKAWVAVGLSEYYAEFEGDFTYVNQALTINFSNASPFSSTWSWDFGDGGSSSSANPSHTYAAAGTYTVTLITSNGSCNDTVVQQVIVENNVGIDDEAPAFDVSVYPNPFAEQLMVKIQLGTAARLHIEAVNLLGEKLAVLYSGNAPAGTYQQTWNATGVAEGVYMINIFMDEHRVQQKVIRVQ